ncbi:hypothetical protein HY358_02185 [Candidatus Roizmanbacteria bacterium]|nr:hypothetical protein [Candidatus Roizmanbacteria bacterium]
MIAKEQYSNKAIAELLRNIAAVYLLKNDNIFKIVAYEKAADTVERMNRELHDIWQENKMHGIPGIGPSIGSHLNEYFRTGKSKHFSAVMKGIPTTVFLLMRVPSIGPKKAFKLISHFKFLNPKTALKDLKSACLNGKVAELETFGEKSQKDILDAIALYERSAQKIERMPLPYAMILAQEVTEYLRKLSGVLRADALGSLRRKVPTIGDIDIAVATKDNNWQRVADYFLKFPKKIRVDNAGERKASIIVAPNIRIDLRVQDKETYGSMLQYFTGSKSHNIKLREYALKKGYSLSEYGIKKIKSQKSKVKNTNQKSKLTTFQDEESFYEFLGLRYIPPEIREGTDEIALAERNQLPVLVESKDIKGDLHIHSSYDLQPSHDSGADPYEVILEKAKKLGYEYVGFADHNPNMGNNSAEDIVTIMKKRKQYINRTLGSKGFPYFIGLEVDILPNGNLALPEKAVEYVDYLIVSIHSVFKQPIADMTKRVLRGLSHPKVKIFGHPTARLLNKRDGIDLEWDKIFAFVKKHDVALEINSGPDRLDLPDTLVREGLKYGVRYVVNTDAHAVEFMDGMFYGVSVARRGWLTKHDIMNGKGYGEFRKWIEK